MTRTRSFWDTWHDAYDDPGSDLAQRLVAVQRRPSGHAIDEAPPGAVRVISACAGQGHDVIGVLKTHPRASAVQALLVESDDHNVGVARAGIAASGITGVDVLQADAGFTGPYRDAVPAHVLMLCGISGNVSDGRSPQDREQRVQAVRASRHGLMDVSPSVSRSQPRRIREWFAEAGFAEFAFDSPGPDRFGLGAVRLAVPPLPYASDLRLFTFAAWPPPTAPGI